MRRMRTALVAVALFGAACGDDGGVSDTDTIPAEAATVIALEVVGGELVGGSRQENVGIGDRVEVVVSGDSDDQIHIHGYDLYVDLAQGAGRTSFDALIPGTFEIELEGSGRLLVRMTVS